MPGRLIYLMGPSGAGKDSLIDAARPSLQQMGCHVAQRVVTRSAESVGEAAQEVSAAEFQRMAEHGEFALSWHANGLGYGIPIQVDRWLAEGVHVLVNGSRAHLQQARLRYPLLLPVLLTVDGEVLRQRLIARGRESAADIEARLQRNQRFVAVTQAEAEAIEQVDNSGELATAVRRFLQILRRAGVSAVPGQI